MVRRFQWSEIVLHWANAVPFLLLLMTGVLNILSRVVPFLPDVLRAIRMTHKITGVVWIVSIGISFFFVGRKLNMANLRDQFGIGFSDIRWMFRALRTTINPHIQMLPAGKFNTGQKINAVLVVLYAAAFAASGALMWVFNTMLLPWFLHVSVFLLALFSLGGHLYLSLMHPSTRPGLIGIFTGKVPRSYVLHHHSLTLEGAVHAHPVKRTGGVVMKAEIALLVIVLILGGFGFEAIEKIPSPDLKRGFESVVAPGDLSKAHSIREISDCRKCHEYSGELPDDKCLSCHKLIRTRKDARAGYHGKQTETCFHCHKEHGGAAGALVEFDKEKFDHGEAAFRLEGKHRDVKCEKCHIRKPTVDNSDPAGFYVGLQYGACLDCHKDIHTGRFKEKKCEDCHSVAGWKDKDLKLDHNTARYRLEGRHANVACNKCHAPRKRGAALGTAVFTGMKFDRCNDCHKDPHRGNLRGKCESCHVVRGWRGKDLTFEHDRDTEYRLEGEHRTVACAKCHRTTKKNGQLDARSFRTKHKVCSDCHKDPHRGEIRKTCSSCHSVKGWKGDNLTFDHDRDTEYRLEGKHKPVACVKCHKTTKKNGQLDARSFRISKPEMCTACHKHKHKGKFVVSCEECHDYASWKKKQALW